MKLASGTTAEQAQFADTAKNAGVSKEKFLEILTKTIRQIEETRFRHQQTPKPVHTKDARDVLMYRAYEEVMRDFDFLNSSLPSNHAEVLKEQASEQMKFSVDARGEQKELRSFGAQRLYRRSYVISALQEIAEAHAPTRDLSLNVWRAISLLKAKFERVNSLVERAGIFDAQKLLNQYAKIPDYFQSYHALYQAYVSESLSAAQENEVLLILRQARTRALSQRSSLYSLWYQFDIEKITDIVAANILQKEPFYVARGSTYVRNDIGGCLERFGVPGSGISGHMSYDRSRRSRPHRDDNSNYGDKD